MAHDEHGNLSVLRLDLLQGGQHEDGRLAHPGLGLAQDVHAEHGLRDALMLHCKVRRDTLSTEKNQSIITSKGNCIVFY